jgi:hypothetical protein
MLLTELGHFDSRSRIDERELIRELDETASKCMIAYLNLVCEDFNPVVHNFLHMLGVKIAESKMLHSVILLEILESVKILKVIVLVSGVSN